MATLNRAAPPKPPGTKPDDAPDDDAGGDGDGGDAQYVTADQLNKAITKQLGQFARRKLPDLMKSALTTTLVEAGLVKAKPDGDADDDDAPGEGEGQQGAQGTQGGQQGAQGTQGQPSKESKRVARLERELQKMREEQAAAAERDRKAQERGAVTDALKAQGVRPEMIGPLATWMLSDESGRIVRRNAEGQVVFARMEDGGGDPDELPLRDGLSDWFKSDAGKAYIPPRPAGGSGFQAPRAPTPGTRPGGQSQGGQRQGQGQGQNKAQADTELFGAVAGMFEDAQPQGQ